MNDTAILIEGLAHRFGRHEVLRGVNLSVPRGQTYAFLGRNGAGKTTTIRTMLGLLKPGAGHVRILGLDPARDAIEIRRRVGYLAEDQRMWGWMTVREIMRFLQPFYPTWDPKLGEDYRNKFELAERAKIEKMSKGQSVRLGLLLALAHQPDLFILDDPTLGLDPIMRKELMRDVIEHLQGRGATVFFSSHLLYEIEPVADLVAILDKGRILVESPTESLRDRVKRFVMQEADFARIEPMTELMSILDLRRSSGQVAVTVDRSTEMTDLLTASRIPARQQDLNLDEIFEAWVIGRNHQNDSSKRTIEKVA